MRAVPIWTYVATEGVPRRSAIVAAVVGTVLNMINQGDALLTGGPVNWLKVALTYAVPYCVSTYGAVSYRLATDDPKVDIPSRAHATPSEHSNPVGTDLRQETTAGASESSS